jgi:hypothetical protein
LEVRRRVEALLKDLKDAPSGETLRQMRGVAVLECIGTADVQELLKTVAASVPTARRTQVAKASLDRLARLRP